jgi:two-component system, OmpR family, phosphate regulon sensor histidine kinase PhoR
VLATILIGVSYFTAKAIDIAAQEEHIAKSIELTASLLITQENPQLDLFAQNIKAITKYRVTVIDENGAVIAESDKDKKDMENHINRPEIRKSMAGGVGVELRHSTSVDRDFVYAAKKVNVGGKELFVRLGGEVSGYEKHIFGMWLKIAIVFGVALALSALYSYRMNKNIQIQIEEISDYLKELENKNYKAIIKPSFAKEFFSIADILTSLTKKLEKQDSQKKKYTAKLKLKNRQTTEVIEAIAHEFKNPVAAVMGYTETMRSDPELDPKIRDKFLEKVHTNAATISKMIDRLSLSLKLENDAVALVIERFDATELLDGIKEQLSTKYKKRNITIESEPIQVQADRTLLTLALTNLIENALKYSEEDVVVTCKKDGENVRFGVKDHGMGIPQREIENITKKFYRVNKNGWDNSMGIGLALVKYILKLHASELNIQSKEALGSTFSFELAQNINETDDA